MLNNFTSAQITRLLTLPCPSCGVAEGSCVTPTKKKTNPHAARIKLIETTADRNLAKLFAVTCPTCGVTQGECVTKEGKPAIVHSTRVNVAHGRPADAPAKATKEARAAANPTTTPVSIKAAAVPAKRTNHSDCDHPSTKSARAVCRRESAKATA